MIFLPVKVTNWIGGDLNFLLIATRSIKVRHSKMLWTLSQGKLMPNIMKIKGGDNEV